METKYQVAGMSHILDDFLFVGPPKSDKFQQDLDKFLTLCSKLGVPIKAKKLFNLLLLSSYTVSRYIWNADYHKKKMTKLTKC